MKYIYIAVPVIVIGAVAAVALARAAGNRLVLILGILATIAALVLFYFNKSDSVDDTLIEQIATATPPLISFGLVIGWWIGWAIMSMFRR